jgi:hypothetical protein
MSPNLYTRTLAAIGHHGPITARALCELLDAEPEHVYAQLVHADAVGAARIEPESTGNGSRQWRLAAGWAA